jgi:hypothetical protein
MKIQEMFLTPNKYSRPGIKLGKVTKIAVHYVGGEKSTAKNTRDYFESLKDQIPDPTGKWRVDKKGNFVLYNGQKVEIRWVSSHFVVGLDGEVIQNIPLDEYSYCTNQANGYSISIETCHPDTTGKFNAVTEKSLAELVAYLLGKYGLTVNDVIRHYDVTGKQCPLYYVTNPAAYSNFKSMVAAELAKLQPDKNIPGNGVPGDTVNPQKLYYVQVGAFSNKGYAESFLASVKKRYADAFIKLYGNMFYVQVGAFGVKKNAEVFRDGVMKDYPDSFIKEF